MKNLFIKIFSILFMIYAFFGFSYGIVYQWFIVSQWETMNIFLKTLLIIVFIILYYLYIKSFIYQITHLKNDKK